MPQHSPLLMMDASHRPSNLSCILPMRPPRLTSPPTRPPTLSVGGRSRAAFASTSRSPTTWWTNLLRCAARHHGTRPACFHGVHRRPARGNDDEELFCAPLVVLSGWRGILWSCLRLRVHRMFVVSRRFCGIMYSSRGPCGLAPPHPPGVA